MSKNQPMTRWGPVPDFESYYLISDEGEVFSLRRNRVMRPTVHSSGHQMVELHGDSGPLVPRYVHQLVMAVFGDPAPFPEAWVLHWDDDPAHNRIENLRWGTGEDNAADRLRNGRNANANKTHCTRGGHRLEGDNLIIRSRGTRECRTCVNELQRERKAARRESL